MAETFRKLQSICDQAAFLSEMREEESAAKLTKTIERINFIYCDIFSNVNETTFKAVTSKEIQLGS